MMGRSFLETRMKEGPFRLDGWPMLVPCAREAAVRLRHREIYSLLAARILRSLPSQADKALKSSS
jgi:hypothetical protein